MKSHKGKCRIEELSLSPPLLSLPLYQSHSCLSEAHNCSCHWVSYWIHTGHLYIDGYKMSKSLKNFITIENYLQGKWSLSTTTLTPDGLHPLYKDPLTAAADLRIFFLHHKYHSTLYLSDATLKEAANWRVKLENVLQLTHPQNMATQLSDSATGPESVRTQRWTPESTELYNRLTHAKQEIHTALCEDFNTPVVLSQLSKLATLVETYYMHYPLQKKIYSIDPIPAVREYIVAMITLFGLVVQESASLQQVPNLKLTSFLPLIELFLPIVFHRSGFDSWLKVNLIRRVNCFHPRGTTAISSDRFTR